MITRTGRETIVATGVQAETVRADKQAMAGAGAPRYHTGFSSTSGWHGALGVDL